MRNRETLKFISNNIKGCKTKIFVLSLCQILLGALVVAFSFMLRYVIKAIEPATKSQALLTKCIVIISKTIIYYKY